MGTQNPLDRSLGRTQSRSWRLKRQSLTSDKDWTTIPQSYGPWWGRYNSDWAILEQHKSVNPCKHNGCCFLSRYYISVTRVILTIDSDYLPYQLMLLRRTVYPVRKELDFDLRFMENPYSKTLCISSYHSVTPYHTGYFLLSWILKKGKAHPCTGTEALHRPYGPYGE